jgi:hypothetical protein
MTTLRNWIASLDDLPVSAELKSLQRCVKGSRIVVKTDGDVPFLTIDGKRQVVSIDGKFDLWVMRRKPVINELFIDDTTPWKFGASTSQAVAFLEGMPKAYVMKEI